MVTKEELDLLLAGLKADVARMRPTPLSMALAADVFWAEDPLPVDIEPPEPDGEAFRGGEAAAYEREQMADWQRLK